VVVLQHHDLLGDASVTCHPGFQAQLPTRQLSTARVVTDETHRLVTSQGPGTAIEFALALVRVLCGDEAALAVAGPMVMPPAVMS
jgi:protein deglycase